MVLAGAELAVPGAYLIWLAGAALTVALALALAGFGLTTQLGLFAVAALAWCVLGWFVYQRIDGGRQLVNEPGGRLVGRSGTVEDRLTGGEGKVRVGDSVWLARGPDLEPGTPVRITAVDGTVLTVAPL